MGFIKDNSFSFRIYLTELGRQKFFDGGLKDAIAYFSVSDADANYIVFTDPSFDPTSLDPQRIPTVNNVSGYTTSLANENQMADDAIPQVFTQAALRGRVMDNVVFSNWLSGVKIAALKDYVMQEPDLSTGDLGILTYIKRNV